MKQSGWRKLTPNLGSRAHATSAGEGMTVSRSQAMGALKRVGIAIGLNAGDLMLLDLLASFSHDKDWETNRRPIVWPSNLLLMERAGFSLSALKRRLRKLAEMGVVAFHDSPNGKRWGRRDAEGHICEAYGVDLAPLRSRAAEFEALDAALRAERESCARLRREITIARRAIRARIDMGVVAKMAGPWPRLAAHLDRLAAALPRTRAGAARLRSVRARFARLERIVEARLGATRDPWDADIPDPREAAAGPHIPTTNQLRIEKSNEGESVVDKQGSTAPRAPQRVAIDFSLVLAACPGFTEWAHHVEGSVRSWQDAHRSATMLAPMIGISREGWQTTQAVLGPKSATMALALVFEGSTDGLVRSPEAYLRGMVRRAGTGALHLEQSLYGRLRARAA